MAGCGNADPINSTSAPHLHWTTTNVGEAAPGVQTPLSWTLWSCGDAAMRETGYQIGLLSRAERRSRSPQDQIFRVFYGRAALSVDLMVLFGDRMPGATGEQVARRVLGRTPDDVTYQPTRRRYPVIAWRFPVTFVRIPARLRRFQRETNAWYEQRLDNLAQASLESARAVLRDAADRLEQALTIQGTAAFCVVEPLYGLLEKIIAKAGQGDAGTLSGSGGSEVAGMVTDLWLA